MDSESSLRAESESQACSSLRPGSHPVIEFVAGASLLGGLVLLDKWALGEFGLSQPIVACPLLGMVYGHADAGFLLGIGLQLVGLASLPLGRERPLDHQGAGVVAILCFVLLSRRHGLEPNLAGRVAFLSLVLGGVASVVGQHLDSLNKRLNDSVYEAGVRAGSTATVVGWHLMGIPVAFARGLVLVGLFLGVAWAGSALVRVVPDFTRRELLALPLAIGVASGLRMFRGAWRWPVTAIGAGFAVLLWLLVKY